MKFERLGQSDLKVSEVCLGTMTWGVQNTQSDADEQLEYALNQGVNYIDTAEMYAIPPSPETYGKTEEIIGNWLSKNAHKRKEIVLATKIAGRGLPWIREGSVISGKTIKQAIEGSLKRLQTDYIDLYQLHWPNRGSPHFGNHWIGDRAPSRVNIEKEREGIHEILQALGDCVNEGKVRYCGLSDDTPWGINEYLKLSEKFALPRIVSIQNEFSLLHTKDWPHLIENCIFENVAYLPWSPLATGALSGKYLNGAVPEGSRWSMGQRNGLFRNTPEFHKATQALLDVANKYSLSLAEMSLAWCRQVDGVTSTIIGATKMEQLRENIRAFDLELDEQILSDIQQALKSHALPF